MKLKINFLCVIEVKSSWYEDNATPEEMLKIELENAINDPIEFFSNIQSDNISISGEVIRN